MVVASKRAGKAVKIMAGVFFRSIFALTKQENSIFFTFLQANLFHEKQHIPPHTCERLAEVPFVCYRGSYVHISVMTLLQQSLKRRWSFYDV